MQSVFPNKKEDKEDFFEWKTLILLGNTTWHLKLISNVHLEMYNVNIFQGN